VNPEGPTGGRLLGLDVGSKTIGMAVSDPLGITAQGLATWRRKNKRLDLQELERVLHKYGVSEVVVGYPLHMSGGPTAGSQRIEVFAEQLRQRFNLPVHLWDERLTTAEAQRLLREAGTSIRRRSQVVDQMAAVLILQAFLENRRRPSGDPSIG
jgi:putative Holliday junction resolvase